MTAIAILYSRQPGNAYTGGGNENVMMFKLATQQVALLRKAGFDAEMPPNTDIKNDGALTYEDNTVWLARRHAERIAAGRPGFKYSLSNHSNAAGDSMVLWGTTAASVAFGQRLLSVLQETSFMPFGDKWTYYHRKVSEVVNPDIAGVLVEWGRHDDVAYAAWLRINIDNGNLATWSVDAIIRTIGPASPWNVPVATPIPVPENASIPAFPLRKGYYFGPKFPLFRVESVSGYFQRLPNGKRGHAGLQAFQRQMRTLGYIIADDGLYGYQTAKVVESFQRKRGLVVDGLIGAITWRAAWTV